MDALAICSNIVEDANNEVIFLSPPSLLIFTSQFGLFERIKMLTGKKIAVRGITDFSYGYIETMREILNIDVDLRHVSQYRNMFMLVGDRRESICSLSIVTSNLSIDTPLIAFWSDDPTYVEYLSSVFEQAWTQATPVAQRIEELLKGQPPTDKSC